LLSLRRCGLDPDRIAAVFVSHLQGDHFGGLPFLILDAQFAGRTAPLAVVGPPGTARRPTQPMARLFPGSSPAPRRPAVEVTELNPRGAATVAGVRAQAFAASHPSGAPALILRLTLGGRIIAYTGDTAWTPAIAAAAAGADLLIAEAYYWDKAVPHHLRHADLVVRGAELTARRTVLTHMSADMLGHRDQACHQTAHDGLVLRV
jgi:ribonuclease BN (tRNA processing enzyme)